MKKLYQNMLELLRQGESFVRATILSSTGSTPRVAGAEMIIRRDGSIIGTIGGGMLEAEVRRMAREVFLTGRSAARTFDLSEADRSGMNMVCGGAQEVFWDWVDAGDPRNLLIFTQVKEMLAVRPRAALITRIGGGDRGDEGPGRWLVRLDGTGIEDFPYTDDWLKLLAGSANTRYPKTVTLEGTRFQVEPIRLRGTVYIFGAGHVSQQLAVLTDMVEFQTVILDDREEYASRERFPGADQVIVLESFDEAMPGLPIDRDSYVVIVTRGHVHDYTVLEQALGTDAGYIGMIGSRSKRSKVFQALLKQGFSERDLERVHSPIGIDIKADTPEEIGVSIIAELIKARVELNQ
ncbi:MAG: XdhC family protein [Firmicutes bacterium]|nr:XdhC family protein [Bacillota bacterium]